jgi:hypothetical protein
MEAGQDAGARHFRDSCGDVHAVFLRSDRGDIARTESSCKRRRQTLQDPPAAIAARKNFVRPNMLVLFDIGGFRSIMVMCIRRSSRSL